MYRNTGRFQRLYTAVSENLRLCLYHIQHACSDYLSQPSCTTEPRAGKPEVTHNSRLEGMSAWNLTLRRAPSAHHMM